MDRPPLSRSEQMSRIRGQNTRPERRLRSALWLAGLRYRLHATAAGARADIVVPSRRVAVFVDGCFWHGCPVHYVRPRSQTDHWTSKLRENVERDRQQTLKLEALGWKVVRIWEHEIDEALAEVVKRVQRAASGLAEEPCADWRVVKVEEVEAGAWTERRHLEQLRDRQARRTEEGRRITAKWKRLPGG
jgi:DNA mismatch endonuclease (patch repair protein)